MLIIVMSKKCQRVNKSKIRKRNNYYCNNNYWLKNNNKHNLSMFLPESNTQRKNSTWLLT